MASFEEIRRIAKKEKLRKVAANETVVHYSKSYNIKYKSKCGKFDRGDLFTRSFMFVNCQDCKKFSPEKPTGLRIIDGTIRRTHQRINKKDS